MVSSSSLVGAITKVGVYIDLVLVLFVMDTTAQVDVHCITRGGFSLCVCVCVCVCVCKIRQFVRELLHSFFVYSS